MLGIRKFLERLFVASMKEQDLAKGTPIPSASRPTGRRIKIVAADPGEAERLLANNFLASFARNVTSQEGEDGVIEEICRRLKIGQGWCVEFGAWDGKFHSNTWNLVHNQGWGAVFIEPHVDAFRRLEANCENRSDIYCFNMLVRSEGEDRLDGLLNRTPIPADFDVLVVDIEGEDYYVWEACEKYRPKIVVIEFNPFIPVDINFVKPRVDDIQGSASLRAICELGKRKGYELICVLGANAFLVRREDFHLFDISDNRPEAMFRSLLETKIFQGYDGTLFLAGNRKLIWRHQIKRDGRLDHVEIADEDIQVLPRGLRVFRPRLTYDNPYLDAHAGGLDDTKVPDNILLKHTANVTSENGEDGILRHVFRSLGIEKGFCVEIGANDGVKFSNTSALINEDNWHAFLIEKDEEAYASLQVAMEKVPGVRIAKIEITTSGLGALTGVLMNAAVPHDFDFLCIDVEGNDYNLWASLETFAPKVVMVDFNPSIPNDVIFTQEDSVEVNHGSSLRAFIELAAYKGYELSAVTSWNAIFVRRDLFPRLGLAGNHIDRMYHPVFEMKIFQSWDCYLRTVGCDRLVRQNYVFDIEQIQAIPPNIRVRPFTSGNLGELRSTFY